MIQLKIETVLRVMLIRDAYLRSAFAKHEEEMLEWKEVCERIKNGEKLPLTSLLADAFAYMCNEFRIFGDEYFDLRDIFFEAGTRPPALDYSENPL